MISCGKCGSERSVIRYYDATRELIGCEECYSQQDSLIGDAEALDSQIKNLLSWITFGVERMKQRDYDKARWAMEMAQAGEVFRPE